MSFTRPPVPNQRIDKNDFRVAPITRNVVQKVIDGDSMETMKKNGHYRHRRTAQRLFAGTVMPGMICAS